MPRRIAMTGSRKSSCWKAIFTMPNTAISPGDYIARAIGAEHEAGSRQGGVVLIFYRN